MLQFEFFSETYNKGEKKISQDLLSVVGLRALKK